MLCTLFLYCVLCACAVRAALGGLLVSQSMQVLLQALSPGDDAWRAASGRLMVGLAKLRWLRPGGGCCPCPGWEPHRLTAFTGRDHGISAVIASCHIPFINGLGPARVAGQGYFDGGLAEKWPLVEGSPLMDARHEETGKPMPITVIKVRAAGCCHQRRHDSRGYCNALSAV